MGHSSENAQPSLIVELAHTQKDIEASQRLRYQIFAEEQGAQLSGAEQKLDKDFFDPYCHHLVVKERETGNIVGSTRILTDLGAKSAGSFYSQHEFDLSGLLPLKGNVIEIGRTCIHKDYRKGAGIAMLWLGLAQFMQIHRIDYMFGCASVSMQDGGQQVRNIIDYVKKKGLLAPEEYAVTPTAPVPQYFRNNEKTTLPPLLRTYLKLGAWVVGEPCLDLDFNCADFFILLDVDKLNTRYHRHFMRVGQPSITPLKQQARYG